MDKLQTIPNIPFPEYYEFFMHWKTPLVAAGIYAITVHLFNPNSEQAKVSRVEAKNRGVSNASKSSPLFTAFIFLHNLLLSIYSFVTFVYATRALYKGYSTQSVHDAYCDVNGVIWDEGLGYWAYLFYLSKFYEVVDTAIIILKGRRSSLLQTYHHSGAMITMWAGVRYQSTPIWLFVFMNSFIHSIMYMYYAFTSIGFHPPGKSYLTTMQITQFLVGITAGSSYLFIPNCLSTFSERFAVYVNVSYLFPLTWLFVDFARRTYSKKKQPVKKVD
ncbi:ELO family [Sporodiniella umbellata]|nr:ELO family [Sporodiniella umbellata]